MNPFIEILILALFGGPFRCLAQWIHREDAN